MTEKFYLINKQTIGLTTDVRHYADGTSSFAEPTLRRIFNFRAREVITIYERANQGYSNTPGSMTVAMDIRGFSQIEGKEEIIAAHTALKRLGGKPEDIDVYIGTLSKKILSP